MDFSTFFKIIYALLILLMLLILVCTAVTQYYLSHCADLSEEEDTSSDGTTPPPKSKNDKYDTRCSTASTKNKINMALSVCLFVALVIFGICWFTIRSGRISVTQTTIAR